MANRSISFFIFVLCVVVCVVLCLAFQNSDKDAVALERFFEEMDDNHDGQVDEVEAKRYIGERIGGQEYDTPVELTEAFRHMVSNIDKDPVHHNVITVAEFQDHLINLQHASVKEWVEHGLGLPQYAEIFKQNVITAADFPLLTEDEGRVLEEELHIRSRLHRNQIVRGMKRLILGLGEHPTAPQVISCRRVRATQSTLQWSGPSVVGVPPVHKYLIERLDLDSHDGTWMIVKEVESHIDRQQYFESIDHSAGRHLFRIVAWTAYGPSPYALFSECQPMQLEQTSISNGLRQPQPPMSNVQNSVSIGGDDQLESHQNINKDVQAPAVTYSKDAIQQQDGHKAGYWSIVVVAVTIALRMLTSRNVAFLKCCFLWKLEKIAVWLRMPVLAEHVSRVARRECPRCKGRCNKARLESKEPPQHALIQAHVNSHKIEPIQHFAVDEARMILSKSSPSLGDPKVEYLSTEWDPNEAMEALNRLPIPDYHVASWERGMSLSSGHSKDSASSMETRSSVDVQSGLIEGQCAFEGCKREWKGVFQFRNRWSRHFCSICMRTYCYEHTHISPHGSFGFCGQHSRCVCEGCFPTLPPAVQAQLEATNKLDKSPARKAELEQGCACSKSGGRPSVRALLGIKKSSHHQHKHREKQKT